MIETRLAEQTLLSYSSRARATLSIMHRSIKAYDLLPTFLGWVLLFSPMVCPAGQPSSNSFSFTNAIVLSVANRVEFRPYGSTEWYAANVNPTNLLVLKPGDRLRTGKNSRALLRLSNLTDFPVGELTQLEIPREEKPRATVRVLNGLIYFFHRDKPGEFQVDVPIPMVSAVVRGTEFIVEVADNGDSKFQVLDGELELTNNFGGLTLRRGEEGLATSGNPPRKTAVITAITANLVQWCLYYPGILNLDELRLPGDAQSALAESLAAYRAGDLPGALTKYPEGREPLSDAEKIYRAALLLTVGAVEKSQALIASIPTGNVKTNLISDLGTALKTAIAAVKFQKTKPEAVNPVSPDSATAWLAESYWQQSQFHLQPALTAARRATKLTPDFAFAWAQVAELEFGFGRIRAAKSALDRSLALAPRNAQALALNGFLLAALRREDEAIQSFDAAIRADGALGNGWLGRGLCRIHRGDLTGGRADLLVAATLEPQRALLRSYLGKAFADSGDAPHAAKEFALAKELDLNDPTAWLYSALFLREQNRFNEAIREAEESTDRNDNRRIYRSRLLLDQDRSVRSSSLASIYRENGMPELSTREAAIAVADSYANYDAHLFLANSLDPLRDPTRFNLRYETAWFNELLLANLLSPVSAGVFAQNISQQEYSQFFNFKKFGLTTTTDVRSDGQYREVASQFGNFKDFSYSLDVDYQHNDGARPNNELDRLEWYSQFKFQLTASDTLFLLTKYQDYHSGDNFQYYDWRQSIRPSFSFDERQQPILIAGYHHEWSPGVHTLLLGGRLENSQRLRDRSVPALVVSTTSNAITSAFQENFDMDYRNKFAAGTVELNQIVQSGRQTLIVGGRFQSGLIRTRDELNVSNNSLTNFFYLSPAAATNVSGDFERTAAYAYYTLEPIDGLQLTGGVAYDRVEFPENFRLPPISASASRKDQLGPKAAVIYAPTEGVTLRGAWTRSLSGVTLDESYRLEPTQLAGFIQTFRSVIPESVVGSVSAPEFETFGGAVDLKFKTGTYLGVQAQAFNSTVDQTAGVFRFDSLPIVPYSTREHLDFNEQSVGITLNQLLGRDWSFGASYLFVASELNTHLVDIPTIVLAGTDDTAHADLHRVGAYLRFNHPSGFFAAAEANWYLQDNRVQTHNLSSAMVKMDLPGDQFTQVNLFIGWRFPRQRGDVTLGLLNVGGGDYHLNPLNSIAELPHERVFTATLRLRF